MSLLDLLSAPSPPNPSSMHSRHACAASAQWDAVERGAPSDQGGGQGRRELGTPSAVAFVPVLASSTVRQLPSLRRASVPVYKAAVAAAFKAVDEELEGEVQGIADVGKHAVDRLPPSSAVAAESDAGCSQLKSAGEAQRAQQKQEESKEGRMSDRELQVRLPGACNVFMPWPCTPCVGHDQHWLNGMLYV